MARPDDLEHAMAPGQGLAHSPIAAERAIVPAPLGYVVGVVGLALAVLAVTLFFGPRGDLLPAERHWAEEMAGFADLGAQTARIASGIGAAVAVGAAAEAIRRLSHSWVAGLLGAALLGLDPALLASGMLGIPDTLVLALLLSALALALSPRAAVHWVAAGLLAVSALLEPASLLWGIPVSAMLVLRGHIYAAPEHLGLALLQGLAIPGAGAVLHWLIAGTWREVPACLDAARLDTLLLLTTSQPGPGMLLLHGPVTWVAGAVFLLAAGLGAVVVAALRFRAARVPGRLQLRVVVPFHPFLGRGVWLLLLAFFAPAPMLWAALFAAALALGVRELADDSPGFGLAIGVVLLAFAVLVLVRSWSAVTGTGGPEGVADALGLVPWTKADPC